MVGSCPQTGVRLVERLKDPLVQGPIPNETRRVHCAFLSHWWFDNELSTLEHGRLIN